jgi:tRNA pseudouridine55 synthase
MVNREEKTGFLLVNKPKNITSYDVIDYLREITGIKKIGHAGTLDPLATGLLIVGIGRESTKKLLRFLKMDKEYIALLYLGKISDTYDKEGKIEIKEVKEVPEEEEIKKAVSCFVGRIKQIPPVFSAKKVKGKKLYKLAREGEKVELKPIEIDIYNIEILKYNFPYLEIKVNCSSGTYIRSLANDIGERLGTGACLEALCRTKIGDFKIEDAKELKEITKDTSKYNYQNLMFRG